MDPTSLNTVQEARPARPFLVVMTMTPLAASVPYSVAADGPFTISMFSISSGLMSLRLGAVPTPSWRRAIARHPDTVDHESDHSITRASSCHGYGRGSHRQSCSLGGSAPGALATSSSASSGRHLVMRSATDSVVTAFPAQCDGSPVARPPRFDAERQLLQAEFDLRLLPAVTSAALFLFGIPNAEGPG
jgi:hypothetical protein